MVKFLRRKIRHFILSVNISYLRFHRSFAFGGDYWAFGFFLLLLFIVFYCLCPFFSGTVFDYYGTPISFVLLFLLFSGSFLCLGFFLSFIFLLVLWVLVYFRLELLALWGLLWN
jgi:hypothetical protein